MKATLYTPYGTLQDLCVLYEAEVMQELGELAYFKQRTRSTIYAEFEHGSAIYVNENGRYQLAYAINDDYESEYFNQLYLMNASKWYARIINVKERTIYNALGISAACLFR